jgi:hypothetical protein
MKAFPTVSGQTGMELRDYFAAAALKGILASSVGENLPNDDVAANAAYEYADAMMEAREAK